MGASFSFKTIDNKLLNEYAAIKLPQVGQALQKFVALFTWSVYSLTLEDYCDVFHILWKRNGTRHFGYFGMKEVGVFEAFCVSYLLSDVEMIPFVQKLDALMSLVQFKKVPETINPNFSYVEPNVIVHRDQLFLMLECSALGLSQLGGMTKKPLSRVFISDIVTSIFEESIQLKWSYVKYQLLSKREIVKFLQPFLDIVYLPDIMSEVDASVEIICNEFALIGDPFHLKIKEEQKKAKTAMKARSYNTEATIVHPPDNNNRDKGLKSVSMKVQQVVELITRGSQTLKQNHAALQTTTSTSAGVVSTQNTIADVTTTDESIASELLISTTSATSTTTTNTTTTTATKDQDIHYTDDEVDYLYSILRNIALDDQWIDSRLFHAISRSLLAFNALSKHTSGLSYLCPSDFANLHKLTSGAQSLPGEGHVESYTAAERSAVWQDEEDDSHIVNRIVRFAKDKELRDAGKRTSFGTNVDQIKPQSLCVSRMQWVEFSAQQFKHTLKLETSASSDLQQLFTQLACHRSDANTSTMNMNTTKIYNLSIHFNQLHTLVEQLLGTDVLYFIEHELSSESRVLALENIEFTQQWLVTTCQPHVSPTGMIKWRDIVSVQEELMSQLAQLREYFQSLKQTDDLQNSITAF